MSLNIVDIPYSYFPSFNTGKPLFNASIYVGVVDKDPEINENQKKVTVRQEDGTEIEVDQPVRTSSGGVPSYNGSPVTILVDGSYSIKVLNSKGEQIYYSPDVTKGTPITNESIGGITDYISSSTTNMIAGKTIGGYIVPHKVNQKWSSGSTQWVVESIPVVDINNFKAITDIDCADFGCALDGSTDDTLSFKDSLIAGVKNNKVVYGNGTLRINNEAKVNLSTGDKLTIDYTNMIPIYGGDDSTVWERLNITSGSFGTDDCEVTIINHDGVGVESISKAWWGSDDSVTRKNIPINIHANKVKILGTFDIKDVWGKALNIVNYNEVVMGDVSFENVGGHSKTYTPDSYGDGIYFGDSHGDATIDIANIRNIKGMTGPEDSTVSKGLSRAGIVFENFVVNGTAGVGTITVNVNGGNISNFERTTHAENCGNVTINWRKSPRISNTAVLTTNIHSEGVSGVLRMDAWDMIYDQKDGAQFQGRFGLGDQFEGNFYGGEFYGLGRGFDGNVDNTPSNARVKMYGSTLFMRFSRMQGRLGSSPDFQLIRCDIKDYSDEQQNASFSVTYDRCAFSTTSPTAYGREICPAGLDVFYDCTVTNQKINDSNTTNAIEYRTDNGVYAQRGKIVKSTSDILPKVPLARYVFTSVDTAKTQYATIRADGTLIGDLLTDNGNETVSPSSNVVFWSFVTIEKFK